VASVRVPCDACGGECEGAAALELVYFWHASSYRPGAGSCRPGLARVCGPCSLKLLDLMPSVFGDFARRDLLNEFQTTDAPASPPHSDTAPGRKGNSDTHTS